MRSKQVTNFKKRRAGGLFIGPVVDGPLDPSAFIIEVSHVTWGLVFLKSFYFLSRQLEILLYRAPRFNLS